MMVCLSGCPRLRQAPSVAAVVAFLALPAVAAEPATPASAQALAERLEKLERRNALLEQAIRDLQVRNAQIDAALSNESVSETEPELATRLKAVEYQALDIQKQAKVLDAIEGFSAGASFTTVAQRASRLDDSGSQVNYRADVTVTTPTIKTGDIESRLFGHFRVGQGKGLSNKLTAFVGPNATSFQLGSVVEPESSAMMLAQAWYQADIPLPFDGFKPHSRETLTINFGKMDPFAFFDQNAAANDETRQFLASPFVHNALLDNPLAANIGADGFGFSPGVRVSYLNWRAKPETYRLSFGLFGAGRSANFSEGFKSPFVIVQAETGQRLFSGLAGNYRFYVWRNGQAPTFAAGEVTAHSGVGVSFDQRFHDGIIAFGRLGVGRGQRLPFDRTVSLGAEIGGGYWQRGADAIGLALGLQRTSADFRTQSATVDANGDGLPDYGFVAAGWEQVVEAYYRFRVHQRFELTPDFQYIRHPAGNASADAVKIVGVRANLSF